MSTDRIEHRGHTYYVEESVLYDDKVAMIEEIEAGRITLQIPAEGGKEVTTTVDRIQKLTAGI